jgi:hypothetical protein
MITRTASLLVFLAFMALSATGCYHATVETGLTPSSEVIEESFASGWIYGLVPPNTISAQVKCKHGVAKVETQHSFVNELVSFITLGIYTPMSIKVTCASAGTSMLDGRTPDVVVAENAPEVEVQAVFAGAADRALAENRPIYVKY